MKWKGYVTKEIGKAPIYETEWCDTRIAAAKEAHKLHQRIQYGGFELVFDKDEVVRHKKLLERKDREMVGEKKESLEIQFPHKERGVSVPIIVKTDSFQKSQDRIDFWFGLVFKAIIFLIVAVIAAAIIFK